MARVELVGIEKRFGGVAALKGVDLMIEPGSVHALLGENGAGKSTLIRILTGAITPDAGTIAVDGIVRRFSHPREARDCGIAAVYQEPLIHPHLSVLENIFAGVEISGPFGVVRRGAMASRARPWFERLDLDPSWLERPMGSISLGYQQLVLIAKALMQEAQVLIFDEPTSILSQAETERLFAIIARLRAAGTAIVYITHRLNEVGRIADQVTVLTDGRVTGAGQVGVFNERRLLDLMAGKASRDYGKPRADRRPTPSGPAVFEISGLCRNGIYQDVNWRAPAGVVTGVYGLVGSGRSEVALAAFGALHAERGEIRLEGKPIRPRDPAEAIALGIAYLPEDRKLLGIFPNKPVEANLTVSDLPRFAGPAGWLDYRRLKAEATRLIGLYRIKARNERAAIGALSGGNQQKALFARWAGRSAKVLIFDEPTRGIDVGTKGEIHDFIRELAAGGLPVVVISSDLPEILAVSDRVIVMRQGRVVMLAEGANMDAETILGAAVGAPAARAA